MNTVLEFIATVSRFCRAHLSEIALAIMACLLVLFGSSFNRWVRHKIGSLNFVFRTLLFIVLCALVYGLSILYLTPWITQGLSYFGNYSLFPVLLLIFLLIGIVADRS
ncbi:hypothetical protein AXE65_11095 [Ventosimonas gracilis]|uniref:DUF3392 domain-containing protein n=1 Tax=Ventosimonas gracilis TaxID=1680762 RepID=A0A139SX02_9GAMM|nr:DUF3392 family protein [Ventosimonas gracilis]KXU38980.1 hypothetical protein AXE65_11095 [Ventosimonas gracilis]